MTQINEVFIEKMTLEDIEKVIPIEEECFSVPWTKKGFSEALSQDHAFYYVARLGADIIGYCGAYALYDEGDVNQVAVASAYRKCGIGKKLVSYMIEDLKKAGYSSVTLEVRAGNEAAIALYEGLGFVKEGIRRNFYEKPKEDALIMWKR